MNSKDCLTEQDLTLHYYRELDESRRRHLAGCQRCTERLATLTAELAGLPIQDCTPDALAGAPAQAIEATGFFFLESTMIGVWVFGWKRLSPRVHALVMWLVALASCGSAFWITSPSISSTRRRTPCAAGCCGPKFKV